LYKKFFFNKIPHIEFCPAVSLEPLDEIKLQHGFCIYVYSILRGNTYSYLCFKYVLSQLSIWFYIDYIVTIRMIRI
jgi:hypothetical protein